MKQCKCTAPTIATKVSENGIYSYCTKCAEEVETFNTKECYHKGKYTYNKETFECHKCGLIVPNEYRFNSKEK